MPSGGRSVYEIRKTILLNARRCDAILLQQQSNTQSFNQMVTHSEALPCRWNH